MRIKKAGGKVFGAVLTAAERKAMDMEINRQIVEADRRYADDIDAMGGKRVQPKQKKKRMKKRTKFTILSIFNLTWYAVVVLILNACGHTVDTELTVGWFAAWTAELAILYGIKVKSKETSDEDAQG